MTEQTTTIRERIVRVTSELLARGGREAASTRSVSAAAGVQAPTIYRQFGDMQGLLDAAARETFANYVRQKAARILTDDPIEDLRQGWDLHVAFGLANPAAYAIIYGDLNARAATPAAQDGFAILEGLVTRIAQAGRLRVGIPHAARLVAAAGEGVTSTLISTPLDARDLNLSAAMREAVLVAITTPHPEGVRSENITGPERVATHAVALRAVLPETPGVLSAAEHHLLEEWLERLTREPQR
jgi:AcrR family transcriptional regulator